MRPPVKYHGGKHYLAKWIVENLPEGYEKMTFVEPFCGAASVLLNKTPSEEEVINDLDENIVVLLRVIRDQGQDLVKKLKKIKYKKTNFEVALKKKTFSSDLDKAVNEFILRRMSRGGLKKSFAWSDRNRGGKPGDVNAWKTILKVLPTISERLKDVYIFNKSAIEIIKLYNDPNTLVYCDPPYLPETRESPDTYKHEMTIEEHMELAELLNNFKGKALISGYPSRLYGKLYRNWNCEKKKIVNHSSQQKIKPTKIELLWMNY